jgi:hypothetical protein
VVRLLVSTAAVVEDCDMLLHDVIDVSEKISNAAKIKKMIIFKIFLVPAKFNLFSNF